MNIKKTIQKEVKHILTEKYQTYADYEKQGSKWGSPEEVKEDAVLSLKRLLPTFDEQWIASIDDVSVPAKGIMFKIELSDGTLIHMVKIDRWRGQWQYYLNKKQITDRDLQKELDKQFLSPVDKFIKYVKWYDFYADYIDDGGQHRGVKKSNENIENMFNELSPKDKREAWKKMKQLQHFDIENAKNVFKV